MFMGPVAVPRSCTNNWACPNYWPPIFRSTTIFSYWNESNSVSICWKLFETKWKCSQLLEYFFELAQGLDKTRRIFLRLLFQKQGSNRRHVPACRSQYAWDERFSVVTQPIRLTVLIMFIHGISDWTTWWGSGRFITPCLDSRSWRPGHTVTCLMLWGVVVFYTLSSSIAKVTFRIMCTTWGLINKLTSCCDRLMENSVECSNSYNFNTISYSTIMQHHHWRFNVSHDFSFRMNICKSSKY